MISRVLTKNISFTKLIYRSTPSSATRVKRVFKAKFNENENVS